VLTAGGLSAIAPTVKTKGSDRWFPSDQSALWRWATGSVLDSRCVRLAAQAQGCRCSGPCPSPAVAIGLAARACRDRRYARPLAGAVSAISPLLAQFAAPSLTRPGVSELPWWDPAFGRPSVPEVTCLEGHADFRAATALFLGMLHLGAACTGYARLAIRHAIVYTNVVEPALLPDLMTAARTTSIPAPSRYR
jgi:hypothetical protein